MKRALLAFLTAFGLVGGGVAVVRAQSSHEPPDPPDVVHYEVVAGDLSAMAIARRLCGEDAPSSLGNRIYQMNRDLFAVLNVGEILHVPAECPEVVPPTTEPPATTVPPTDPPTTTTEPPTTTTEPLVPGVQFFEDFATPEGLYERFEGDVHFRANDYDRGASFHGDHDMACGNPNVSARTVHVPDDDGQDLSAEVFYHCIPNGNPASGHFMTAMGPAGFGYSVLSLRPLQTFHDVTKVCIDASNTQLGGDVWWELSVVPKDDFDANGGRLDYITAQAVGIDDTGLDFPDEAFVYQLWDNKIRTYQGMDETLFDWFEWSTADRAPRYQHCLTDNGDGTVTIDRAVGTPNCCEPDGVRTVTVDGSFPAGESVVLIQHSTYDPPKHGSGPDQTTIHWDNLLVE